MTGSREPFVPLLLEADESEPVLRGYLDDGELFELRAEGRPVGVALLLRDGDAVEIKNIALARVGAWPRSRPGVDRGDRGVRDHRGRTPTPRRHRGRQRRRRSRSTKRAGSASAGVRARFFDAYPHPVVEDGRVAHDMVLFERALTAGDDD